MCANILDEPATEFQSVSLNDLAFVSPLRATELLRDVFPESPELYKIHFVIESECETEASSVVALVLVVRMTLARGRCCCSFAGCFSWWRRNTSINYQGDPHARIHFRR